MAVQNKEKRTYRQHSLEEKRLVLELHEFGMGSKAIGRLLEIDSSMIRAWLRSYRQFGIAGLEKKRYVAASPELRAEVLQAVCEGRMTQEAAAFKFGVCKSTVARWMTLKAQAAAKGAAPGKSPNS